MNRKYFSCLDFSRNFSSRGRLFQKWTCVEGGRRNSFRIYR
jgi:hypothetical protein